MSVKYSPVQWTQSKLFYDAIALALVVAYVLIYLRVAPTFTGGVPSADGAIVRARAFGTCAFLLLTVILCIGPLARFDRRFLPLLYNRRHLGVITCLVALTHAAYVLNWYFNFSSTPRFEALLTSNTSYGQILGFPFEAFGILALLALLVLAVSSHDFWLSFLTAPVWKLLHYAIYPAYGFLVAHIALGALQSETNATFAVVTGCSVVLVCGLHAAAAIHETRLARTATVSASQEDAWFAVGKLTDFEEGRAQIRLLDTGERVAVFLHEGHLAAIGNACAHQNGPLGEGRILDGCVTCPWHGFQYRLSDGCSPAPFTEKVPTYNLRIDGEVVLVDARMNPLGTKVDPVPLPLVTQGAGA
ncbi:MAG: nitrite reductase/ring-hydroxylating ferredoxin subunit/DMSO [Hyphomicrobiaceae bacterium]|jgi:nitrite reductase/ring-hydroxylating ferredoxin subunit/DMSO/TMAO reductase YedYZ heme-binding membrane subunit